MHSNGEDLKKKKEKWAIIAEHSVACKSNIKKCYLLKPFDLSKNFLLVKVLVISFIFNASVKRFLHQENKQSCIFLAAIEMGCRSRMV
jgi:hypothetical protein